MVFFHSKVLHDKRPERDLLVSKKMGRSLEKEIAPLSSECTATEEIPEQNGLSISLC